MSNNSKMKRFFIKKNIIANILFYVGILLIIFGLFLLSDLIEQMNGGLPFFTDVPFFYLTEYFVSTGTPILYGVLFIAISEGIELMQRLVDRKMDQPVQLTSGQSEMLSEVSASTVSRQPIVSDELTLFSESRQYNQPQAIQKEQKIYNPNEVPEEIREKIITYYSKKGETPIRFYKTPFVNTYFIELDNNQYNAVIIDPFGVSGEIHKSAWTDEMVRWFKAEGFEV